MGKKHSSGNNMGRLRWYILMSVLLAGSSVVFYLAQIAIFHRSEDTFFYLLQDIAFVPIQVLLVTLIIARLLKESEKRALLKKLNMLIGAFYSEVGTDLIRYLSHFSMGLTDLTPHLIVKADWSRKDFANAIHFAQNFDPGLNSRKSDLIKLRGFLEDKRGFMLSLLANPTLLEHNTFTDLLWAVLHLSEELTARHYLTDLPESDYQHLTGDMQRAYMHVLSQWLAYMRHLKEDYPYLFSLAVRTNPMDVNASPVVNTGVPA
jgi:hypothetical protein